MRRLALLYIFKRQVIKYNINYSRDIIITSKETKRTQQNAKFSNSFEFGISAKENYEMRTSINVKVPTGSLIAGTII